MDRYSPKRSLRVPGCEFVLRWSLEGKPPAYLKHHIPLNGAKGDKYFTLYIPALGKKFTLIKWAVRFFTRESFVARIPRTFS